MPVHALRQKRVCCLISTEGLWGCGLDSELLSVAVLNSVLAIASEALGLSSDSTGKGEPKAFAKVVRDGEAAVRVSKKTCVRRVPPRLYASQILTSPTFHSASVMTDHYFI